MHNIYYGSTYTYTLKIMNHLFVIAVIFSHTYTFGPVQVLAHWTAWTAYSRAASAKHPRTARASPDWRPASAPAPAPLPGPLPAPALSLGLLYWSLGRLRVYFWGVYRIRSWCRSARRQNMAAPPRHPLFRAPVQRSRAQPASLSLTSPREVGGAAAQQASVHFHSSRSLAQLLQPIAQQFSTAVHSSPQQSTAQQSIAQGPQPPG